MNYINTHSSLLSQDQTDEHQWAVEYLVTAAQNNSDGCHQAFEPTSLSGVFLLQMFILLPSV
jgi:hypothetical protein